MSVNNVNWILLVFKKILCINLLTECLACLELLFRISQISHTHIETKPGEIQYFFIDALSKAIFF